MSSDRDLASFARAAEALAPYLADLVFVGGWAHYFHTLLPDATPLAFAPLATADADVATPLGLAGRAESIRARLLAAGFVEHLSGDHEPPASEYVLAGGPDAFSLEFLSPLLGSASRRGGAPDATAIVSGVSVQKLRHLEILLHSPIEIALSGEFGFPVRRAMTIRVASPASYVVQKVLALPSRNPAHQPKDVLYLHDTFATFADALPVVRRQWDALRPRLHRSQVTGFASQARALGSRTTDLVREAARMAAGRPRPPTPEQLVAALRAGFSGAFGVDPG